MVVGSFAGKGVRKAGAGSMEADGDCVGGDSQDRRDLLVTELFPGDEAQDLLVDLAPETPRVTLTCSIVFDCATLSPATSATTRPASTVNQRARSTPRMERECAASLAAFIVCSL